MIWLAIDTTAHLCAAALYDSGQDRVLAKKSEDIGRGHAERLMGLLGELLDKAGIGYQDIDQIGVTCGPGSFTGIRVGLATARGLALGLDVPVVGVNVLEAIAWQLKFSQTSANIPVIVALDAKRGEVFMQTFSSDATVLSSPRAVALKKIADHLPNEAFRLAGSASELIIENTGRRDIEICSKQTAACIESVATLAAKLRQENNRPEPLYLRQADAKPQNSFSGLRTTPQEPQKTIS